MTKFLVFSLAASNILIGAQELNSANSNLHTETAQPKAAAAADSFWNFLQGEDGELVQPQDEEQEQLLVEEVPQQGHPSLIQNIEIDANVIEAVIEAAAMLESAEEDAIDVINETIDIAEDTIIAEEEPLAIHDEEREEVLTYESRPILQQPVRYNTYESRPILQEQPVRYNNAPPAQKNGIAPLGSYPEYYNGARRFKNQQGFWSTWDHRRTWYDNWKTNWNNNRRSAYERRADAWANRPIYALPKFNYYQRKPIQTNLQYDPTAYYQPALKPETPQCPPGQVWSSWSNGCVFTQTPQQEQHQVLYPRFYGKK